jgi:hypothetical protein
MQIPCFVCAIGLQRKHYGIFNLRFLHSASTRGSQSNVVYLGCLIAPLYMIPNGGGGGFRGLSKKMSSGVHIEPK